MSNKPVPLQFGSIDEFRKAAKASDEPVIEARVRASFDTEVKAAEDSRTLSFTISSKSVDRMGDTIDPSGWDLNAYHKNPVVLWAHDSTLLPVAKAPKVWFEGEKMKADAEFTPLGLARFNDTVFEMYKQGFLSATSVGFIPLKYAFTDDPQRRYGMDFLEQELLEFSCVPVPANSDALIEGRAAGIDILPVLDWAEDQIKRCGDNSRVLKLAESVLGSKGDDLVTLSWAERIITSAGKKIADRDEVVITRAAAIAAERAAKNKRLTEKRQRELDAIRIRSN
jgi:HK97 family phage prohead protease